MPVAAVLCMLGSSPASAQPALQLTPSFNIVQSYDSNLFFAAVDQQRDYVTRMTPGLDVRYQSPLFSMTSRYAFDFERFTEHPALTAVDAQHASAGFRVKPARRFEFGADAAFARTQTPSALGPTAELILTRAPATSLLVHPSAVQHLDANTEAAVDGSFAREHLFGGARFRTETAAARLERRASARQTIGVTYSVRRFDFEPASATTAVDAVAGSTSHALNVALTRNLTRETSLTLQGGPRVTDGRLGPELAAFLHTVLRNADFSLAYSQTQTALLGVVGIVDTRSVTASAIWKPSRLLQIRTAPSVFRFSGGTVAANAYRIGLDASQSITGTVSIVAAYDQTLQQGRLYSATAASFGSLSRRTISIGLTRVAATPAR